MCLKATQYFTYRVTDRLRAMGKEMLAGFNEGGDRLTNGYRFSGDFRADRATHPGASEITRHPTDTVGQIIENRPVIVRRDRLLPEGRIGEPPLKNGFSESNQTVQQEHRTADNQ